MQAFAAVLGDLRAVFFNHGVVASGARLAVQRPPRFTLETAIQRQRAVSYGTDQRQHRWVPKVRVLCLFVFFSTVFTLRLWLPTVIRL